MHWVPFQVQGSMQTRSGLFIVLVKPTINDYLGNLQSLKKVYIFQYHISFWICLLTFSVGIIILPSKKSESIYMFPATYEYSSLTVIFKNFLPALQVKTLSSCCILKSSFFPLLKLNISMCLIIFSCMYICFLMVKNQGCILIDPVSPEIFLTSSIKLS